jgi:hypothetical protein
MLGVSAKEARFPMKYEMLTGFFAIVALVAFGGGALAGNWDGNWAGPVEPQNTKKCDRGTYNLTIHDDKISGTLDLANPNGNLLRSDVSGEVDPTGTATLIVTAVTAHARHSQFKLKYAGGKFSGTDRGDTCTFSVELSKQS